MHKVKNEKLFKKVELAIKEYLKVENLLKDVPIKEIRFDEINWYIDGENGEIVISKFKIGEIIGDTSAKRIILTRKDILSDSFESKPFKMGAGKLAAQVAHAVEGMTLKSLRGNVDYLQYKSPEEDYELSMNVSKNTSMSEYLEGSFTKIILTCKSKIQFLNFYDKLVENNIGSVLIIDSGFTVFDGNKTETCIGIQPEFSYIIDCFTSRFQLLK